MSRVVVIGAGVIGLCTAWSLQRRGHEVVVIDRGPLVDSASWGNAGWLVPSLSAPVPGPGMAQLGAKSLLTPGAPFRVRPSLSLLPWTLAFLRSCTAEAQRHGFEVTMTFGANTHQLFDELVGSGVGVEIHEQGMRFVGLHRESVEQELQHLQPLRAHGYELPQQSEDGDEARAHEAVLSDEVAASALLGGDKHLDPRELADGLEKWLRERGATVDRRHEVSGFARTGTEVRTVRTSRGTIDADVIVVAAGAWSSWLTEELGYRMPLQAGKGYSFSTRLLRRAASPLYLLEAKVAVTPLGRDTRFAGSMELTGIRPRLSASRVAALIRDSRRYIRDWPDTATQEHWAGLRPMVPDGLPVIGRVPGVGNVFVATGHAMLGVTLGPSTGEAIADQIDGADDGRLAAFDPRRFS